MWKIIGLGLLLFLLGVIALILIARFKHRCQIKIDPNIGIEADGYVCIGDLSQYVQIRGQHKDNPLLVLMHGGPGEPFAFLSYVWQLRLEEEYTVVHWNQRQSGRTYFANRKCQFQVSFETLVTDLDELVDKLSWQFDRPIFLMGHSWGTAIAVEYISRHPEKIAGYIGIGQMVDYAKEAEIAYQHAYNLAAYADDTGYLAELRHSFHLLTKKLKQARHSPKTMAKFDAKKAEYLDQKTIQTKLKVAWYSVTSPLLTMRDLQWLFLEVFDEKRYHQIQAPLTKFMMQYQNTHYTFQLPVVWLAGDEDYETPYTLVKAYVEKVTAPAKAYIELHGVGHSAFLEDGDLFCETVIQSLEPYR